MQLPFFQQRQLEHARDVLTRSVYKHTHDTPYPVSSKERESVEKKIKQAYKCILKLSRRQAQWLAKKNYSDAEKSKILILLGCGNTALKTTDKKIQVGLAHLTSKTR